MRGDLGIMKYAGKSKINYAIDIWKIAGPWIFVRRLLSNIYSLTTYIGLVKDLGVKGSPVSARIEYTLQLASDEDMEEVFQRASSEDSATAHELLHRKSFYNAGYHNCYIARASEGNEICHLKWIITTKDIEGMSPLYRYILGRLTEKDMLTENTFTFPKYRKSRVGAAVRYELSQMAKGQGFTRMFGYVQKGNTAALKSFLIDGYAQFEEVSWRKLFFRSTLSHKPIGSEKSKL